MNIETKSCTVQLTNEDIKGLRLMAKLYLENSAHSIQQKVSDVNADEMDAASNVATKIIEQL